MTQYTARFNEHALHAELKALDEILSANDLELSEGEERDGYDRFARVVDHVKRCVGQVDPELVSAQALTGLQKQLHSLKDHHDAFKQNKDVNALNNQADAVLNQLHLLPKISDGAQDFSGALEDLRRRANETIESLQERCKATESRHDKLKGQIDDLRGAITEQQGKFEAQKGRIDELITNQQAKFNEEQQQRNSQFNDGQTSRDTLFKKLIEAERQGADELLAEKKKAADDLLTAKAMAADDQRDAVETRASELISALEGHQDDAKRIVGLIGNTGMTGHYQKVANRELWRAEILRVLAVLFFVLMVVGVGWVVKEIKSADFSWEVALFRVGVALTLLAPAIYCARESTRHRRSENRNRRIELELASINPYLDSLPDEEGQAVIKQLAVRYFGNAVAGHEEDGATTLSRMRPEEFLKLFERVLKMTKP